MFTDLLCAGGSEVGMKSRVHLKYKTKYRVTNWAEYEQGLIRRGESLPSPKRACSATAPVCLHADFGRLAKRPTVARARCEQDWGVG
jgi:hypothetical protein